jgi:magnesium chelatase family protein
VPAINVAELMCEAPAAEGSASIRERVKRARLAQKERLSPCGIFTNSRMDTGMLKRYCVCDDESKSLLRVAAEKLGLSARSYDKILKVARTIADLEGTARIGAAHIAEAIQYRCLDRIV